jgi:hypothetical protein
MTRLFVAAATFAAGLGACEQVDVVVVASGADPVMDASAAMDAAESGPDAAGEDAAADTGIDTGPDDDAGREPVEPCPYRRAPAPGSTTAIAELIASNLQRAICACGSYSGSAGLTVDRLDGTAGGDVGVNEGFDVQLSIALGGSLTVAGNDGMSLGSGVQLTVGRDLAVGGPLEGGEASVAVAGEARVAGRIDLVDLQVTGALRHTSGEALQVVNEPRLGVLINEAVQVDRPCACDAAALLDVGELVRVTAPALPALQSAAISGPRCGQYALDGDIVDTLVLGVSESAALYVRGNLHLDAMTIDVAPGAALDLFLEGNLSFVRGPVELGSPAGGVVRVHVGGTGTIELQEGGSLHGTLYAPNSELVLSGALDVRGALIVERVAASATVVVHFDARASEL